MATTATADDGTIPTRTIRDPDVITEPDRKAWEWKPPTTARSDREVERWEAVAIPTPASRPIGGWGAGASGAIPRLRRRPLALARATQDESDDNEDAAAGDPGDLVLWRVPLADLRAAAGTTGDGVDGDGAAAPEHGGVAGNDLRPGVYEGGLKTWEGALDLAAAVADAYGVRPPGRASAAWSRRRRTGPGRERTAAADSPPPPGGRWEGLPSLASAPAPRIVELGCGHALPGAVAALALAARAGGEVCLTDFNESVLATAARVAASKNAGLARNPDAVAGGGDDARPVRLRYFAGDWSGLASPLLSGGAGRFCLVLTAETCYDPAASARLLDLIDDLLVREEDDGDDPTGGGDNKAAPSGVVERGACLVAGKRYYFGVGGGTQSFAEQARWSRMAQCTRRTTPSSSLSGPPPLTSLADPPPSMLQARLHPAGWDVRTVWSTDEGLGSTTAVVRDILLLQRRREGSRKRGRVDE